ncbi:hypothetical protein [Nitriliruptor alkaliphilus]|uniref:hypothetical protein n=1 Tax=Nitriliruptor alkaliphilus TaxID=427918 RepID=UPI000697880E|nr:hypothetical protein [Nitriliruptor alkaliphilus]
MARTPFNRRPDPGSGVARLLARGLAGARVAVGVALVAAPDVATRRWLGSLTEDDPGRQVAVRGIGARDVALGIGALVALRDDAAPRQAARWLEAGVVADLADAGAIAVADDVDASKTPTLIVALGAAALGLVLRTRLR